MRHGQLPCFLAKQSLQGCHGNTAQLPHKLQLEVVSYLSAQLATQTSAVWG